MSALSHSISASEQGSPAPPVSPAEPRLTRKEAALLAALRASPGRCLSREFLLHEVWGYGEGAKSRTVDVHIWKLRAKLGPEGKSRIRTVMRAGYCWNP